MSSHFLLPLLLGSQCVYLFISPFLSFLLSGWILYVLSFSISSATGITVCLLIYFPFPLLPAVWDGHYISSHFLFSLLLGSQWVYLFIFPFLYFLLFWMDTICPVIFYFPSHSNHNVSTYLFPLSFTSCFSGWTLYVQSFSISSATRITVCLLIYFPFPLLPAVLDGHYISSHFYFLCYTDHSVSTYLFPPSLTSCSSGWTLYIQSFSISSATQITESLIIYFPFPFLTALLLDIIYPVIFFSLLLGSQCVYLFISPFLSFLLFWMETTWPYIFYFLYCSDHSVSIYLFPLFSNFCCSGWTLYVKSFYITYATLITVGLLIYFSFPLLPAVLDGHYMSKHFLFPQLLET